MQQNFKWFFCLNNKILLFYVKQIAEKIRLLFDNFDFFEINILSINNFNFFKIFMLFYKKLRFLYKKRINPKNKGKL